jgi:two-component system CheB/CheR fusion protein
VAETTPLGDRRHPVAPFAERQASEILESLADPLVAFDRQYRYTYVSRRACEVLGKTHADLIGRSMWEIFPPALHVGLQEICDRVWASGKPATLELYSNLLGQWVETRVYPLEDGAAAQWRDITERRQVEERARARAAELEAVMEAVPVAIIISRDPEGRDVVGNRQSYEMHRCPVGSNLSAAPGPDQPRPAFRVLRDGVEVAPEELPIRKAVSTGLPVRNYELDLVLADGTTFTLLGHAVPLFAEDGSPSGAVAAFLDVTERKRSEERLRQTQKLEGLGLLAGGIAHEFNNLLTGIMGNASMIVDDVPPEAAAMLSEVISSADRAAHLTRQLLAYSGKGQFIVRDLDVSQALHEIASLAQFSLPKSVDLAVTVQQRLPSVRMDPSQFQQIVMNLVVNAGEAIGEGNPGKVVVSSSLLDVDGAFVDAAGDEVAPGRYVRVEVADTGCGIEPGNMPKVFEPFFTTRFTGRGLGLAAVAGILRALKGGITVDSTLGAGSTFRVLLPAARRAALQPQPQPAVPGQATILVVDSEAAVRDFIAATLRRHGHRVLAAFDDREALALFEKERVAIDGIVLDIVTPTMGANDRLLRIRAGKPGLKVLLTSGYSEPEARRLCPAFPGATFIQKPYTAQQIAAAVEQLLRKTYG